MIKTFVFVYFLALFLAAAADSPEGLAFLVAILPVFILIYAPITWIAYRNALFHYILRWLYSLTVLPVAFIAMVVNYKIVADYFPTLLNLFDSIPASGKSSKPAALIAFFITCPLAVVVAILWYKIFFFLNKCLKPKHDGRANLDAPDL